MRLTYWHIQCNDDADCYSIRARTKRAALAEAAQHWNTDSFDVDSVHKVTVEYTDGFDLLDQCTGEGGAYWEHITTRKPGDPEPQKLITDLDVIHEDY